MYSNERYAYKRHIRSLSIESSHTAAAAISVQVSFKPVNSSPLFNSQVIFERNIKKKKEVQPEAYAIADVPTSTGLYNLQLKVEFTAAGPVVKVIQTEKVEANTVIGKREAR